MHIKLKFFYLKPRKTVPIVCRCKCRIIRVEDYVVKFCLQFLNDHIIVLYLEERLIEMRSNLLKRAKHL